MGSVNWVGNKSVMYKTAIAYLLKHQTSHLQGIFRGINEFIIDEGEPISIEMTNESLNGFSKIHNNLMGESKDLELKKYHRIRD